MPRVVDHEQRRTEIAYGVIAVAAEQGLAAVSLRSVAAAAGVSMGRVQHYFADKDELVRHACRLVLTRARQQFESDAAEGGPRENLRNLLVMTVPHTAQARLGTSVWYAFIGAAATDPDLAALIREGWQGMQETATDLVRQAAGSTVDAVAAGHALAASADGLVLRVLLGTLTPAEATATIDAELDRWLG